MADNIKKYNGVIGIVFQRTNPIKYCLIHNKKTGNITFPAGGSEEFDVSIIKTLEREIKEETGLLSSDYKIIETPLVYEFVYNSKKKERAGKTAKQRVYLIETKKTRLKPIDSDSVIIGRYTAEKVDKLLTFSDSKELFKKAIKYI